MSIPNYLTFFRIFISPIFLLVYLEYETFNINLATLPYILLFILGISELSDACDGYLARKYNQVTDLGKILDPMADSIYRISIFLTFTLPPIQLPMILIFVFLYRDSVISTLRTICALKGFALAARPSGKLKAVIQAIAAFTTIILLIPYSMGYLSRETLQQTSTIIVSIAALYSLFSGVEYLYANRQYIMKLLMTQNSKTADLVD
ncbi:CDP-diacylglycerol-glycerol-3-phosphate 3-phosphatidyltransferase [Candidatus Protochlamydia naegleriophila]|uniref:CDP-diacylglycerol--glycerol-3-phosphate 3-phosphatidyltransferase n=1 Tax=Candidatus Protochlamydia naegleriophila TaxID=389348 RepID=A0A0U5JHC0_9BACT|nr:CDP-diacylglycerol--glycerol-3-phosphate 3-phosphatidyltransferase [Candidatus Protochlamydia naegleriophila]CUI17190.1 CDP-diacylglycerol-glycerol-3-phosphate 3-phosphatidyltransferase [Candidatus Protochlamydia naegleriophila]